MSTSKDDPVTGFMLPSPSPLPDESTAMGAELVMDPLDDGMLMPSREVRVTDYWLSFKFSTALFDRWNDQARVNAAVYARLFRTVPSNAVKSWDGMKVLSSNINSSYLLISQ
jgi:hypothetical protein